MKVPLEELERRVARLQRYLQQENINGALLAQRLDAYYYSGTAQNIHVYIPQEGRPLVCVFRNYERAQVESPWTVVQLQGLSKLPEFIQEAGLPLPHVLGLEYDVLPVAQFNRYLKSFANVEMRDISAAIRLQRAVKSPWELTRMQETSAVSEKVFQRVTEILRSGITEVELQSELDRYAKCLGHEGFNRVRQFNMEFFFGCVTAGDRAAVGGYFDAPVVAQGVSISYPQGCSHTPIMPGESVIVDFALVVNGYMVDQTRNYAIGFIPLELQEAQKTAQEIQERIRQALVPGVVAGDIYQETIDWVKEHTPYEQNFMGYANNRVNFLAHGIGLELDEMPTISLGSKTILEPGMVLAVEPKFVFPGLGVVGVEDTMDVADGGARFITKGTRDIVIV